NKVYQENLEIKYESFPKNLFTPECTCHKNLQLVKKTKLYSVKYEDKSYDFNPDNINFTCDVYRSLKRGPGQKIISYSLYGDHPRYFELIPELVKRIKQFYPGYIMRIYYDNSINKSIICDYECRFANMDFCNIHKIPVSIDDLKLVKNYNVMHSMMWRFLSIGDSFVDLFMSRDTDSLIHQREYDAVKEWIESDKPGHIMRGKRIVAYNFFFNFFPNLIF
ncbi:unnamed protein product, partial [Brachionus calyciflorus]